MYLQSISAQNNCLPLVPLASFRENLIHGSLTLSGIKRNLFHSPKQETNVKGFILSMSRLCLAGNEMSQLNST